MPLVTKGATIQVRVTPLVKSESERVLRGIGLNMSEAIELFLRRIIVDARIPFEVISLDSVHLDAAKGKGTEAFDGMREARDHPMGETFQKLFSEGNSATHLKRSKRRKTAGN